jgi:hypothetical protein
VGRFPGGQTLYVEPSSIDNLMIAVLCRFPGGQTYVELTSVDNPRKPTHTAIIRLSTDDSSTYNVCPPGNLHTQLSLGYL